MAHGSRENRGCEHIRVERLEVVWTFAEAGEKDGSVEFRLNGARHAALARAVELG